MKFILKHKNDNCALVGLNDFGALVDYKPIDSLSNLFFGKCDKRMFQEWWKYRAVPSDRTIEYKLKEVTSCNTNQLYSAKNFALSFNDCYWLCPLDEDIKWEQINLFSILKNNDVSIPVATINGRQIDANSSLGGQLDKTWSIDNSKLMLVKMSSNYSGQQLINELVATMILEKQNVPSSYVKYEISRNDFSGMIESRCETFTKENLEFISAMEVLESGKKKSSESPYDYYIKRCVELGLDQDLTTQVMDFQTLFDYIIANKDRHLNNFGLLRDSNTLKVVDFAPIFDSGNSFQFDAANAFDISDKVVLETEIKGLYDRQDAILKRVKNLKQFDLTKLPNSQEIKDIYIKYGIPESKAEFIIKAFEHRVDLLSQIQNGKKIGGYST